MAARWPLLLPQQGLRDGFSRGLPDNLIVSDTDTGDAKSRPRSSNAAAPFRLPMLFTITEVELFWRWWREVIGQGAFDFWFPAPGTHGLALATETGAPILTDDGAPILIEDWWLSRFAPKRPKPVFEMRSTRSYVTVFELERLW